MGLPRFRPSRLFANPRDFGRSRFGAWADPVTLTPAEVAWAVFQHRAALVVTQTLAGKGESIAELAEDLGEDPEWLAKKIYGQAPADLGDITAWALKLGVDVLPVFDTLAELQAPPRP
jgi:hypothetical protein